MSSKPLLSTTLNGAVALTLPSADGVEPQLLEDAVVVPGLLQSVGIDPAVLWSELTDSKIATHSRENVAFCVDGMEPIWVRGDHPALKYRGNELKRHKMWLQTHYSAGLLKYGYTGWQHAISFATRDVASVPAVQRVLDCFNRNFVTWTKQLKLPAPRSETRAFQPFNHAIVTRYDNHKDNIGFHSDKTQDFADDSYFVVLKLGAARNFSFALPGEEKTPFWTQKLEPGTAVLVRATSSDEAVKVANALVKHAVPEMKQPLGESGSIVLRAIKTQVPWDKVLEQVKQAQKQQVKRIARKREATLVIAESQEAMTKNKKQRVEL
eukprot:gb/GEZN01011726.1/.p1 GENE.gb/GEZN01011726.1/~~gb/GEZN01011726.1/.p1  ORF type:complete len:323 (+),score=47.39 gb/GEZN01011726.1/:20-988(+)